MMTNRWMRIIYSWQVESLTIKYMGMVLTTKDQDRLSMSQHMLADHLPEKDNREVWNECLSHISSFGQLFTHLQLVTMTEWHKTITETVIPVVWAPCCGSYVASTRLSAKCHMEAEKGWAAGLLFFFSFSFLTKTVLLSCQNKMKI